MCIRDSADADHRARAGGAGAGGGHAAPGAVRAGLCPRHGRCLLYTSDAADERSSVDLGGRGIIKKKKNDEASAAAIMIVSSSVRGLIKNSIKTSN